jgi:enoyl-CoA hydratase
MALSAKNMNSSASDISRKAEQQLYLISYGTRSREAREEHDALPARICIFPTAAAICFCVPATDIEEMLASGLSKILAIEQKGPIVSITLNRPEKCNALSAELSTALLRACESLTNNAEIIILRGNGRHFCAGSDLTELHAASLREAQRLIQLEIDACHALASLPQLTVAVTHGKCYGGGAILPLYCDLRIGRPGVEFALPEVPFGWIPPYGIERMMAALPRSFSLEMLLSGRVCGDAEALEKGWIHRLENACGTRSSHLDHLLQLNYETLRDTVSFMANKDLERMRQADHTALHLFLQHFDTEYAQSELGNYMNKKRF